MDVLRSDSTAAAHMAHWRPAADLQEVASAVCSIRSGGSTSTQWQSTPLNTWLPGTYEVRQQYVEWLT